MVECPSCGHKNIEGADQCDQCQADLVDVGLPENTAEGLGQRLLEDSILKLQPDLKLTVAPDTTVADVAKAMIEQHASGVMITQDEKLVGVFTERDFLLKIADRYDELSNEPIEKFMTPKPEALRAQDSIAFGLNGMAVKSYRHLPIVKDDKPLAMVRTKDVLKYIAKHYPGVA